MPSFSFRMAQFRLSLIPLYNGVALLPLVFLVLSVLLSQFIPPFPRLFNPSDPSISFPYANPETVSTLALFAISTCYPTLFLLFGAWRSRFNLSQFIYSLNALFIALTWTMFTTAIIKLTVGRLRPDFLARCKPVQDPNVPGGWICTGDPKLVHDGRLSFPSGHSSLSFSGGTFLLLFLYGTLTVHYKRNVWIRSGLMLLIIPALLTAISRLCDYRHHAEDVIGGAIIGILISWFWYHTHFVACDYPAQKNDTRTSIGAPLLPWSHSLPIDTSVPEYTNDPYHHGYNGDQQA